MKNMDVKMSSQSMKAMSFFHPLVFILWLSFVECCWALHFWDHNSEFQFFCVKFEKTKSGLRMGPWRTPHVVFVYSDLQQIKQWPKPDLSHSCKIPENATNVQSVCFDQPNQMLHLVISISILDILWLNICLLIEAESVMCLKQERIN